MFITVERHLRVRKRGFKRGVGERAGARIETPEGTCAVDDHL